MKFIYSSLFLACLIFSSNAQETKTKKTSFTFKKEAVVNLSSNQPDYSPKLLLREMPKQRSEKIETYNYPEDYKTNQANKMAAAILPTLSIGQSFVGNPWGLSTPNDNDMAISNSGMVISVINTNIFVRNTVTNVSSPIKSLALFTTPINNLHQEFDPKVMYDPNTDRFVLVCLVGFVDTTSKIIVGFSQTNNPAGNWNLYSLPGNPLNNNLWSDYPMISMTDKELFLSINLLYNNQPWQTGFVETLVWQMKKDSGYAGLPLNSVLHSNIKFNGKPIRNLCPVKGGSQLYSPNMYFISNRNLANQNDTVFLVNVTDTIGAPTGTVTTKALVSNQPYYFPVDGRQTNTLQTLATNDCRNLGAFYENGKIQYVHNTNHPTNNTPTIYYGIINNPATVSPTATGYIIQNDTMDFAYPNISYAGNSSTDNTSIFSFNHSSNKVFAGTSAIRADGLGDFSPILRVQNGTTYVNLLSSNQERWGDYSGSQRRYNNPGKVWMSGYNSYVYSGSYPWAHRAWITELSLTQTIFTGIKNETITEEVSVKVFPNPAKDIFSVELNLSQPEYLSFELYDQQGKLVVLLLRDWVKVTQNTFSFSTQSLSQGVYLLKIKGNYNTAISKKVVVE
ncbi:T9SS type A sorting domain-containing protein [Sediminibacterium sp.]|uniref:T9SS type A sorting domain-containing protein n=1 Tax=Sediminibacterium sp. TaxID=1917865 RepID=UPI0027367453|nr:T9SS type A sorting domain-containing protein [Sediminibacterium sp.]MDP3567274.1 T9SS type A sorting domain-containing protein [Sediminibacterium sp.]